jgi:hypothetical protein
MVFVAAAMVAQDKAGLNPAVVRPVPDRPATRTEFFDAADRLAWAAAKGLGMPVPAPRPYDRGDDPITRSEAIAHLSRLKAQFQPRFRFTPFGRKVDVKLIESNNPKADHGVLKDLVEYGLVAPVGPIVAGPEPTLSVDQAGAALGHFFCQLAALTAGPDQRFTPRMMK